MFHRRENMSTSTSNEIHDSTNGYKIPSPARVHTSSSQSIWPSGTPRRTQTSLPPSCSNGTPRHRHSFLLPVPPSPPPYLRAFFLLLPPPGLPSDLALAGLALRVTGPVAPVAAAVLAGAGGGTALAGLTTNRLDFFSFFWPHECIAWMSRLPTEPDATRKIHLGMRETKL